MSDASDARPADNEIAPPGEAADGSNPGGAPLSIARATGAPATHLEHLADRTRG
ncbi:hypothetical protein GGD50_006675 [Rhizobium paranaense]|uniref:Uncharacterized protein n=1 Tax=Rhizobium paranaense TaxID=1650438 RepID=A0A7W8XZ48_9HYPH|nr:hypothetical protein [Rhizobium paranaense]